MTKRPLFKFRCAIYMALTCLPLMGCVTDEQTSSTIATGAYVSDAPAPSTTAQPEQIANAGKKGTGGRGIGGTGIASDDGNTDDLSNKETPIDKPEIDTTDVDAAQADPLDAKEPDPVATAAPEPVDPSPIVTPANSP